MQLENFLSKRCNLMWKDMSNVPMSSNQMLQTSLKFTNEFSIFFVLEFYLFIKCIVVVSILFVIRCIIVIYMFKTRLLVVVALSCTKTIPMTCVRLKMACTKLCWIKICCMLSLFVIFQLLVLNFQIGDVNYVKGIKKIMFPFFVAFTMFLCI
jgi:hypothetical protein